MVNAMSHFEYSYVPPSKVKALAAEAEDIIAVARSILRDQHITFQHVLVGSGDRDMVTYIEQSNSGFDLDYNLVLQKVPKDLSPKDIKDRFHNAFSTAVQGTGFNHPQDSTSVLTIKKYDMYGSIERSFDLAILKDFGSRSSPCLKYIRFNKPPVDTYTWEKRGRGKNFDGKVKALKEVKLWNEVRKEYLKVKNGNDDEDKRSFDLYAEAVCNVYDQRIRHHKDIPKEEVKKWQDRITATSTARLRMTTMRTSSIRTTTHTGSPEAKRKRIDKRFCPPPQRPGNGHIVYTEQCLT